MKKKNPKIRPTGMNMGYSGSSLNKFPKGHAIVGGSPQSSAPDQEGMKIKKPMDNSLGRRSSTNRGSSSG